MTQSRTHRAAAAAWAIGSVLALSSTSLANDWYVDAVNGSNSNDGASPATAWLTISHAVAQVPAGSERILIAPGTYRAALGEVFPIAPKPGHQLIGVAGLPRPILTADNAPGSVLIRFESTLVQPLDFGADTRLEHLELRRAARGVELIAHTGHVSPTLVDLAIERMVDRGVSIFVDRGISISTLERVDIGVTELNGNSVAIFAIGAASRGVTIRVRDSKFRQSGGIGALFFGHVDARFEGCLFDGLGAGAISAHTQLGESLRLACVDTAITYSFWPVAISNQGGFVSAELTRCTAVENWLPFSISSQPPTGALSLKFDSSVIVTQGPLLQSVGTTSVTATRSLISDGSFDGVDGCFSGDPGFRNAPDGDFRLRWGSPCIDAAFVNAPAGARDAVGALRDIDGNLDTLGRTDLGAYEFQPLELTTSGALASSFMLENWGPQNAPSIIYWARAGLAGSQPTPFGAFQLNPQLARTFRVSSAGASAPATTVRMIPNQLALVGQTFSFQAFTDSPAAPLSRAFTNGVEFTVTP